MKQLTQAAQAAKQIRTELKTKFPTVKFSVNSENYSMRSRVAINWMDGPTTQQVEAITDKYQYGHFDGMTDMYEYSNTKKDIPQAKYVHTNRTMSEEAQEKIIKEHNEKYSDECQIKDVGAYNDPLQEWNTTLIYRIFHKTNCLNSQKAEVQK